ncbi:hypothetical protein LTR60_000267 [Cryomyces antarcticus]|nr:hypothetical protein LTR39_000415 [Cryomyces antarcticus]KAK5020745.1 hypothetical protein LTR60_000267 [Cryomyces antarcticus]
MAPTFFAGDVLSVAAIRSTARQANELFALNQNLSLMHYWQDPTSTLWHSRTASIAKSKYIVNFESYTMHIHLESNSRYHHRRYGWDDVWDTHKMIAAILTTFVDFAVHNPASSSRKRTKDPLTKFGKDAGETLGLVKDRSFSDLKRVILDMLDTLLSVAGALIEGRLLEEEWDLPIISALYEFVTELMGDVESFNVLNGVSFLIAVPVTIAMECAGLGSLTDFDTFGMERKELPQQLATMASHRTVVPTPMPKMASIDSASADDVTSGANATQPQMLKTVNHRIVGPSTTPNPPPQRAQPQPATSSDSEQRISSILVIKASAAALFGNVADIASLKPAFSAPYAATASLMLLKDSCGAPYTASASSEGDTSFDLRWTAYALRTAWDAVVGGRGRRRDGQVRHRRCRQRHLRHLRLRALQPRPSPLLPASKQPLAQAHQRLASPLR